MEAKPILYLTVHQLAKLLTDQSIHTPQFEIKFSNIESHLSWQSRACRLEEKVMDIIESTDEEAL